MSNLPTLCEITYGRTSLDGVLDWIPYRHTLHKFRDHSQWNISGLENSIGFYDSVTVGCRTPLSFLARPCTVVSSFSNPVLPSRAHSLPAYIYAQPNHHGGGNANENDRCTSPTETFPGQVRRERIKTAPSHTLPNLVDHDSTHGANSHHLFEDEKPGRLRWIPALDAWVEENQNQKATPYTTFVSSLSIQSRGSVTEVEKFEEPSNLPCERFTSHMNHVLEGQSKTAKSPQVHNERILRQRERRRDFVAGQRSAPVIRKPTDSESAAKANIKVRFRRTPETTPRLPVKPVLPPPSPLPVLQTDKGAALSEEDEDLGYGEGDTDELPTPSPPKEPSPSPPPKTPTPPPTPPPREPTPPPPKPPLPPKQVEDITPRTPKPKQIPAKEPKTPKPRKPNSAPPRKLKPLTPRKTKVQKVTKPKQGIAEEPLRIPSPKPPVSPAPTSPTPPVGEKENQQPAGNLSESSDMSKLAPRGPLEKKVRWRATKKKPCVDTPDNMRVPNVPHRPVGDWIYGDDSLPQQLPEDNKREKEYTAHIEIVALPELPKEPEPKPAPVVTTHAKPPLRQFSSDLQRKRWGPKKRDSSYAEDLERQRRAEERRKKAQLMYEKLRKRKISDASDDEMLTIRFEDYGFLAKYCIFNRGNLETYRRAFNAVDEEKKGFLNFENVFIALRGVNRSLSDAEEEYMFRILELTGYKATDGADFKLFAVMAALSQRITSVDNWMRNMIGTMDFHMLQMKMFMCKTLWECNVDPETNKIPIDQLCVELRAGGISYEHECEVRDKLSHLVALDLLDFLTYVPLFIMIHQSVVHNPLEDKRDI